MLQVHENALLSSNTIYHEFLLAYKEMRKEVYGFVEGKEDPMYYVGLIENRIPSEWSVRLIRSGSKEKVLDVFGQFDWNRFDNKRICFFVDRDLSLFTDKEEHAGSNLYITDEYSLENQIATPGTFIRTIKEIYGVSNITADEEAVIVDKFNKNMDIFCDELVSVMAQIVIWRRNGSRACLDNIKLNDIFIFNNDNIVVREAYENIENRIACVADAMNEPASELDAIRGVEEEFRAINGKERFIRGKYVLWFFVEYAKLLHGQAQNFCSKINKAPKVKVSLGKKNAMAIIGPRARIPDSLAKFIDDNYLCYIQSRGHELIFSS